MVICQISTVTNSYIVKYKIRKTKEKETKNIKDEYEKNMLNLNSFSYFYDS